MPFVYVHAVGFAVWMLFLEQRLWPTLTRVVSLEAIFLSTFVMIGQNRQAAFQQSKADHADPVPGTHLDGAHGPWACQGLADCRPGERALPLVAVDQQR